MVWGSKTILHRECFHVERNKFTENLNRKYCVKAAVYEQAKGAEKSNKCKIVSAEERTQVRILQHFPQDSCQCCGEFLRTF